MNHMSKMQKGKNVSSMSKTVALKVNEIDVTVEPDSSADANLMDEYQSRALLHRSDIKCELQPSKMKRSNLYHMIRSLVDLRVPNKFIERNIMPQGPIAQDFTSKFHDCTIFFESKFGILTAGVTPRSSREEKLKRSAENRNSKEHTFNVNDYVLLKTHGVLISNQLSLPYIR